MCVLFPLLPTIPSQDPPTLYLSRPAFHPFRALLTTRKQGKLALHEIMAEDSLVSYWEKFGAIAFDQSQKAILTSCTLKNPHDDDDANESDKANDKAKDGSAKESKPKTSKHQGGQLRKCCFSFTIRRDIHNM